MSKILILLFMSLFIFSCSQSEHSSIDFIHKELIDIKPFNEATPLVVNGEFILFFNNRSADSSSGVLTLEDSHGNDEIIASGYTLGCALVVNGEVVAFGTTLDYLRVYMFKKVNGSWISTLVISVMAGEKIYNTSVTATNSDFVMAYEVEISSGGFSFKYARSNDLVSWSKVPNLIFANHYTACPTIRYFHGVYYVTYLVYENDQFVTRIARSTNLAVWRISPIVVIAPSADEGRNASDLDFVEYQGETILYYIDGDQMTWGHLRRATYNGGLESFLKSFF